MGLKLQRQYSHSSAAHRARGCRNPGLPAQQPQMHSPALPLFSRPPSPPTLPPRGLTTHSPHSLHLAALGQSRAKLRRVLAIISKYSSSSSSSSSSSRYKRSLSHSSRQLRPQALMLRGLPSTRLPWTTCSSSATGFTGNLQVLVLLHPSHLGL